MLQARPARRGDRQDGPIWDYEVIGVVSRVPGLACVNPNSIRYRKLLAQVEAVVVLVNRGWDDRKIARALSVSPKTVGRRRALIAEIREAAEADDGE